MDPTIKRRTFMQGVTAGAVGLALPVVRTARLFIGNDAGPAHVAGASGIPTLALFGPTDPHRWSPRGPVVTTLSPARPVPMSWLDPKTVLAVCEGLLTQ